MRMASPPPSPEHLAGMPGELAHLLREVEQWAALNRKDARESTVAFWTVKAPAIVASAGAGIIAHYGLPGLSLAIGCAAGFCVLIDGLAPRGGLRNAQKRASHDLRNLSSRMVSRWRTRDPAADAAAAAGEIIREAELEWQRITVYLRDAEAALKTR